MKNLKKILSVMLTSLMVLSLVACGGSEDKETAYEPQEEFLC